MLAKLAKRDEAFTVYTYDNGYMVEITGRDDQDDWTTLKIVCSTLDEVIKLIRDINDVEVNR